MLISSSSGFNRRISGLLRSISASTVSPRNNAVTTRTGTVKLAESELGRSRVGRVNGRLMTPRDPILRRSQLPRRDYQLRGMAVFSVPLNLRMVEEMLAARGITVTYETIRQWGLKFGREFANRVRLRAPRRGDKWHLVGVVISFARKKHWSSPGPLRPSGGERMRAKIIPHSDAGPGLDNPAKSIGTNAGLGRRVGAFLLREVREILPSTVFFFIGFNLIVLTTNLDPIRISGRVRQLHDRYGYGARRRKSGPGRQRHAAAAPVRSRSADPADSV